MTLESALIPFPSEITMPFAGFLVSKGQLNPWFIIIAGTLGNVVGSWIAFALGYWLEETVLLSLIKKYGKIILLSVEDYHKSEKWFKKYGDSVVFFSRLLPAVRTFISLPVGMYRMNFTKFTLYTFVGSLFWSGALTYIGIVLGKEWNSLEVYYRKFELAIAVGIVILVLWYINHKLHIIKFSN